MPWVEAAVVAWEHTVGERCSVEGLLVYVEPREGLPYARYSMGVIRVYRVDALPSLVRHETLHHCAMQARWPPATHHERLREMGLED